MVARVFALFCVVGATLTLLAVSLKLAVTGETDWPILAAALLILPSALVAWRRSLRGKRATS